MQAVLYMRCSTKEQAAALSLDTQRARLAGWTQAHDARVIGEYVDVASGKRADNRPQLQEAIAAACKHKAAFVVVRLDRATRNTQDALAISETLRKGGAAFVSIEEHIDTLSPHGELVFTMLAAVAQMERRIIGARTRESMRQLKSNGRATGGNPPYGYFFDDSGAIQPDAKEQHNLKLILRLRSEGASYRQIAAELKRRKVQSRSGSTDWRLGTLLSIVRQDKERTADKAQSKKKRA